MERMLKHSGNSAKRPRKPSWATHVPRPMNWTGRTCLVRKKKTSCRPLPSFTSGDHVSTGLAPVALCRCKSWKNMEALRAFVALAGTLPLLTAKFSTTESVCPQKRCLTNVRHLVVLARGKCGESVQCTGKKVYILPQHLLFKLLWPWQRH